MDLNNLYEYYKFIMNKDSLGEPDTPENFSMLCQTAQPTFVRNEYKLFVDMIQASGIEVAILHLNNSPFKRHIKTKSYRLPEESPELAVVPEDMFQPLYAISKRHNVWRNCELMDESAFNNIRYNMLGRNVDRKPIFYLNGDNFIFVPKNTREAKVSYIKNPPTPYFDTAIGVEDYEIHYMPPGSYINISDEAGTNGQIYQYHLYDENGTILSKNVLNDNMNVESLPYYSKSVELDWDDETQTKIIDLVISSSSVRSRENIGGKNA